ncbi:MAG: RQC domain-containing protein, partial [Paracoccaceae bacterium]
DSPPELFDATTPVRQALSAMLRTGEYFGAGHLIDILLGNQTDKVRMRGHHRLPTFGVGGDFDRRQWQAIFRQMMGHDLVRPDVERFGGLRLTERARPILRGEAPVTLRRDALKAATARAAVRTLVSDEDAPLLGALKARRRALAEAARVPAYIIFNDRTLIEMAEKRPADLDAMAAVNGVGATKLARYGATFLQVITGAEPPAQHPKRRQLAGRPGAAVYDRLLAVQAELARGELGADKPISCSASLLAKVAQVAPDAEALNRVLGERRARRFGAAFLQVLREA